MSLTVVLQYMILIGVSGLFLFATSVGVVAFANQLTASTFNLAWSELSWGGRQSLQEQFDCCGLDQKHRNDTARNSTYGHPVCSESAILTSTGVRSRRGGGDIGEGRGGERGLWGV